MKKRFLLIASTVLSVILYGNVRAQTADKKEEARVFVQKFYDWYGKVYAKKRHITAQYEIIKRNPQYLAKTLLNALLADERAWARYPRVIIGLDFDPFTNTLDTRKGYQTGLVTQKGDKFFVGVYDIGSGQSKKEILSTNLILTAEIDYIHGHWIFENFVYPRPYALDNYGGNLLGILDSLHKDRIKQGYEKP